MVRFMRLIQPRGRPSLVALIEERNELVAENAVEVFAVAAVVEVQVGVDAALADGEAVEAVVGLGPPAIEHGEIEAAVENHLLPAGAGGFERTARIVEPDIDALDQMAADVDVVILHEDEFVAELGVAHHLGDLLEDALARLVVGMGLAGEEELHGALGIVDHGGEALHVGEQQVGALVGGEAAGEADGERIGREHFAEACSSFGRLAAALCLLAGAAADEVEELRLQAEVRLPELAIVDVFDLFPGARRAAVRCQPTPRWRS